MKGKEFLDEDNGYFGPWWDYDDDDILEMDLDFDYKTTESGLVDISEYMSKSLRRKSLIEKILGETPDYLNTIDKYWPDK